MNIRALGVALIVGASIASPHGSGDSNAQERGHAFAAAQDAGEVVLASGGEWTAPEWEYNVQLLEPSLRVAQGGSRNPAGRLVLPAPQTSHAPAF